MQQTMKITMKWLFLHPYSTAENDADQKQKPVLEAVQPVPQLMGL